MDILEDILKKSLPLNETKNFEPNAFKKNYINKKRPVILKGLAKQWKAKKDWDFDFFLNLESNEEVLLEVGNIIQNDANFLKKDFKSYINELKKSELEELAEKPYLSMFNIFDTFPHLKKDVDFSIFSQYTKKNYPSAWIGPSGTISGLHWDTSSNLLVQLKGKKLLLLASPKYKKEMYINRKFDDGAVSSKVDINNFDEAKFPKFKNVDFFSFILEPGDAIYIPKGWWHYVKSLESSISVNNFGYFPKEMLTTHLIESVQMRLHMRGLYRANNCTCHKIVNGKRVAKNS